MFKLPAAETMTSPQDSVTLIMAAAFAWAENDPMARNVAKVSEKILVMFTALRLVLKEIREFCQQGLKHFLNLNCFAIRTGS